MPGLIKTFFKSFGKKGGDSSHKQEEEKYCQVFDEKMLDLLLQLER
jgi:hypothetical protein